MSDMLENTELLIQKNSKKKNQKGRQLRAFYTYELHMTREVLSDVSMDAKNPERVETLEVNLFTLETLAELISFANECIRKGVRSPILFYSRRYIMLSDNLTASLLEYIILYYYKKEGTEIYVTQGLMTKEELLINSLGDKRFCHNGFFCGSVSSGFMCTSFLLSWLVTNKKKQDESLISDALSIRDDEGRRYKTLIGKGPWDASIAISECQEFLNEQKVSEAGIAAVMDVIGELGPNATEHGDTNCIIDLSCEECVFPDENGKYVKKGINVSLVIFDFSEKLLGTDLKKKIFVDSVEKNYRYKTDRIEAIRKAWDYHKNHLTDSYKEDDFSNVIAFQKLSGRPGDRPDGGLGISTLIKRVQQYTKENYCYVLSGHGGLRLDQEYTGADEESYIGFNEIRNFKEHIPDTDAVLRTRFYMPGVAYNLCFNFMED